MTESNSNKSCCVQLEKTIFDTSVTGIPIGQKRFNRGFWLFLHD